jgi:lysophospholipase L1-like esterase
MNDVMISDDIETSLGKVSDESFYYQHINWDNYINLTPYEYGLKNNLMEADDFHLTSKGMNQWASEIKHMIKE